MSRKIYVLVHGAWHGAWSWERIGPLLTAAGHGFIARDLPACGVDETAPGRVSLSDWTESVCAAVAGLHGQAVLVGHSRAGIVISQVAERLPEKVSRLVYVSGLLLRDGESVLRFLRGHQDSPFLENVTRASDGGSWLLPQPAAAKLFYGDCSDEDTRYALARLGAEPAAPMLTALRISELAFGRVPRAYIECRGDNAIPLSLQRRMQAALACDRVATLDSGHAPFISSPAELTAQLLALT